MNPTRVLWVSVAASLVYLTGAFLPNYGGDPLPATDYTLTEITTVGIVRAVARYYEDTNPDKYEPGDLTNLDPLTPSNLFRKHFGENVFSTKFERAIKAITDENVRISNQDELFHKAIWHFGGNLINKGNSKMISIRKALLKHMTPGDDTAPDYDRSRVFCGQFLHMAQKFYSNTNWIELNRWLNSLIGKKEMIIPSSDLGVRKLVWQQSPGKVNMCQTCPGGTTSPDSQDCKNNLKKNVYYLTSGFRDGQDVSKPDAKPGETWGKCSHGGTNDASWTTVPSGGINKETSDPKLSPHYYLHNHAALTAIQATEDFFYHPDTGLYKFLGDAKFRKLLSIDIGASLTFVIDTTGSMADDIKAVKEETINIVNMYKNSNHEASKYVIAPFNDPEYGPVLVTTDPYECIDFLSNLTVDGGGDCPEMSNSGLELGVKNSLNGEKVYLFTDADDKDKEKKDAVLALIDEKDVEVCYFLTNDCKGVTRRKRATSTISQTYYDIASASGGEVYQTDKKGIADLVKIIAGEIRASEVTLVKRSSTGLTSFDVEIPVDSTVQEIMVHVVDAADTGSHQVFLVNPQGVNGTLGELGAEIFTDSSGQTVFSINTTKANEKGLWILKLESLTSDSEYRIKVTANSILDFTAEFLQVDEMGMAYPLEGKLSSGDGLRLLVQVSPPDNVAEVGEIRLMDVTGERALVAESPVLVPGRTSGLFKAEITVPDEPFIVSITGKDQSDMTFLRTKPSEIDVVDFKLEKVAGTDSLDELVPGGRANFSFRIINPGVADTMDISVSVLNLDDSGTSSISAGGVTATVEPPSVAIDAGKTVEGVVTISASEDVEIGTSAKVTLTITSRSLSAAQSSLSVDATVFAALNETDEDPDDYDDKIPPTCDIQRTVGGCTAEQMSQDCHLHEWQVEFLVQDERLIGSFGLDPKLGESQTLEFEFNPSRTVLTGNYTAPCCCPMINFTVSDTGSNTAWCGMDFYTSVSDQIDEPVCNGPEVVPDIIPPTCNIPLTVEGCTAEQMNQDCYLHEWQVRFLVQDEAYIESFSLDPEPGESQTLVFEEDSSISKTGMYTSNCCCPMINFTVIDRAGNTASCGEDFYTPVSDQIKKPVCNGPITGSTGLSTGAIVGIAVGAVAGAVILIGVIVLIIKNMSGSGKAMGSVTPINVSPHQDPVPYTNPTFGQGQAESLQL